MFLCSPSRHSFGYCESNKKQKTHFPKCQCFWSVTADRKPQHPCMGFVQWCLLPAGSPYKGVYPCQSDHASLVGGEQEPAGSFSQNQVSQTLLQELPRPISASINPSRVRLLWHPLAQTHSLKAGLIRNEVTWEQQGTVSLKVTCREPLLTRGTSVSKLLLLPEAWRCSWWSDALTLILHGFEA